MHERPAADDELTKEQQHTCRAKKTVLDLDSKHWFFISQPSRFLIRWRHGLHRCWKLKSEGSPGVGPKSVPLNTYISFRVLEVTGIQIVIATFSEQCNLKLLGCFSRFTWLVGVCNQHLALDKLVLRDTNGTKPGNCSLFFSVTFLGRAALTKMFRWDCLLFSVGEESMSPIVTARHSWFISLCSPFSQLASPEVVAATRPRLLAEFCTPWKPLAIGKETSLFWSFLTLEGQLQTIICWSDRDAALFTTPAAFLSEWGLEDGRGAEEAWGLWSDRCRCEVDGIFEDSSDFNDEGVLPDWLLSSVKGVLEQQNRFGGLLKGVVARSY